MVLSRFRCDAGGCAADHSERIRDDVRAAVLRESRPAKPAAPNVNITRPQQTTVQGKVRPPIAVLHQDMRSSIRSACLEIRSSARPAQEIHSAGKVEGSTV